MGATMSDWADLYYEAEPFGEAYVQRMLVDFRTMNPKLQRDFIVSALDECVGAAKEGKIEKAFAGQVLRRAQLMASFLETAPVGTIKMVRNG
jgi:hypothetical protein